MGLIYVLKEPSDNTIRYIGKTICLPRIRYAHHIFQWKRCNGKMSHLNSWIKSLAMINLKPILEIIEDNIPNEMIDEREIYYIKHYKENGARLCNHTDGGGGIIGFKMSDESIAKRLKSLESSVLWKERSARHSEIMKQKHKDKSINFGYSHLSEERRIEIGKKISKSNTKVKNS